MTDPPTSLRDAWAAYAQGCRELSHELSCFLYAAFNWWLDLPVLQAMLVGVALLGWVIVLLTMSVGGAEVKRQRQMHGGRLPATRDNWMRVLILGGVVLTAVLLTMASSTVHGPLSEHEKRLFDVRQTSCLTPSGTVH